MEHSIALGERLLREHHFRVKAGPRVIYPPKTTDAAKHWKHTGVCSECDCRAISAGICRHCGAKPGEA